MSEDKKENKPQVFICTQESLLNGAKIVVRDEDGEPDYLATHLLNSMPDPEEESQGGNSHPEERKCKTCQKSNGVIIFDNGYCGDCQPGNVKSHDPAHFSGPSYSLPSAGRERLNHLKPLDIEEPSPCPRCFGRGQVGDPDRVPFDVAYQVRCPECRGTKRAPIAEGSHRIAAGHDWPLCPTHRSELYPAANTALYCTSPGCDHAEVFQGEDPDPDEIPIICFTKDMECPRCKGAGKIPNLKPGENFIDCPNCAGEGKTQTYEPVTESQLDEGIALGMELAQLRKAKTLAEEATSKILGILSLAYSLASNTPHYQAEAAAKNIKEAIKATGDLQIALRNEAPAPKQHPEDAAIQQAKDLAEKGYAAVYGTPLGQGVYMVDENHAKKMIEQTRELGLLIQARAPSMSAARESQRAHNKILDALADLIRLLPGGVR